MTILYLAHNPSADKTTALVDCLDGNIRPVWQVLRPKNNVCIAVRDFVAQWLADTPTPTRKLDGWLIYEQFAA